MLTRIFSPSLGHSFDQESIAVVKSEAKGTEVYTEHSGCLGLSTSNTDSSFPRLAHGSVNISVQGSFPSCQSQDSLFPAYPILTQGHFSHLLSVTILDCHNSFLMGSLLLPSGPFTPRDHGCFSLEEKVCYYVSQSRSLCSRLQSLPCKDTRGKRHF